LSDLRAACDAVVAVDSGSSDGSAEMSTAHGAKLVRFPWQGFGAARAKAVSALAHCDWVFFLDADERLSPESIAMVRQAASSPHATAWRCRIRDWAGSGSQRFLYRAHHRVRLLRRTSATWAPHMVVHESTGQAPSRSGIIIDHEFAPSLEERRAKHEYYAWLWAVRARVEGRRVKWPPLERAFHFFKDAVLKGAALRGGLTGVKLAWAVSQYHARKYECLKQLNEGKAPQLAALYGSSDFQRLFEETKRVIGGLT